MCGALNITRTWKSETEQVNNKLITSKYNEVARNCQIICGGFGMPKENIVGIVCGTSEVGRVHVMAVLKMFTAAFS